MIRLRKPLSSYSSRDGVSFSLGKLRLLMEKEHNRGQDGAGMGCVSPYCDERVFVEKALGPSAVDAIFTKIDNCFANHDAASSLPQAGVAFIGHLRYSTTGKSGIEHVHPFLMRGDTPDCHLLLCGNFNMTNIDEIAARAGLADDDTRDMSDTATINHQLSRELHAMVARDGSVDLLALLRRCASVWDGGYAMCGLLGSGEAFVVRDPHGIRPVYYYVDDEYVSAASERSALMSTFRSVKENVKELPAGSALLIDRDGVPRIEQVLPMLEERKCLFERIYFARGNDEDIYEERKRLGRAVVRQVVKAIDGDFDNTVFSFVPHTAEIAYMGMVEALGDLLSKSKKEQIKALDPSDAAHDSKLESILLKKLRTDKIVVKNTRKRIFITEGLSRDALATNTYDINYGQVRDYTDNIVIIDDSMVRGTTLRRTILPILDNLRPKKIVFVSSSPQFRYPDCYGIDVSSMTELCAFRAAIDLLCAAGRESVIDEVYDRCKRQQGLPPAEIVNHVKEIYAAVSDRDITKRMAQLVTDGKINAEVELIFQDIDDLRNSIPHSHGDWYFTGNYPTAGGRRMLNNAFIAWYEHDFRPGGNTSGN